jgi:ubiquinone/menaquinone biosynthesis C-methylase UbiE
MMALMNGPQNRMMVELLEVRPEDQVLEIGLGPGTGLKILAEHASAGFVAGIDLSDEMIRAATRRNRESIQRGRVELQRGSVSAIPYEDNRFDKVCTANTIYFWPEPERDALEIRRVMRPGGTVVVCFRGEPPEGKRPTRSLPPYPVAAAVVETMEHAGFSDVRAEVRKVPLVMSACVVARKV